MIAEACWCIVLVHVSGSDRSSRVLAVAAVLAAEHGNSLMNALTNALPFDALAVRLNAPKTGAQALTMAWFISL